MRILLTILCLGILPLPLLSQNSYLLDPFSGDSLVFTALTRSMEVEIDNIDTYDDLSFLFFTFEDEALEAFRKEQLMPFVQQKWKDPSLVLQIKEKSEERLAWIEGLMEYEEDHFPVYRSPHRRGYVTYVRELSIYPLSFVDSTLTFVHQVACELNNRETEEDFEILDFYFVDLAKKQITSERLRFNQLNRKKLQLQLQRKWEKFASSVPIEQMVLSRIHGSYPLFQGEQADTTSISLYEKITAFWKKPVWEGAHHYWNGSALVLRFPMEAGFFVPWNQYTLQLTLDPSELEGVFEAGHPYTSVSTAIPDEHLIKDFNSYYFNRKQWNRNLTWNHINYIQTEDQIDSIVRYFQQYSRSPVNEFMRIRYDKEGRAIVFKSINASNRNVDSLIWEGEQLKYMITRQDVKERGRNRTKDGFLRRGTIYATLRDTNNNLSYELTFAEGLKVKEYNYFSKLVHTSEYLVLEPNWSNQRHRMDWFHLKKNGWCYRYGCGFQYEDGRPIANGDIRYVYNEKKLLIQELRDQHYKLFSYDNQDRLSRVEEYRNDRLIKTFRYQYEGDLRMPHLIEELQPSDKEWRKHGNRM